MPCMYHFRHLWAQASSCLKSALGKGKWSISGIAKSHLAIGERLKQAEPQQSPEQWPWLHAQPSGTGQLPETWSSTRSSGQSVCVILPAPINRWPWPYASVQPGSALALVTLPVAVLGLAEKLSVCQTSVGKTPKAKLLYCATTWSH